MRILDGTEMLPLLVAVPNGIAVAVVNDTDSDVVLYASGSNSRKSSSTARYVCQYAEFGAAGAAVNTPQYWRVSSHAVRIEHGRLVIAAFRLSSFVTASDRLEPVIKPCNRNWRGSIVGRVVPSKTPARCTTAAVW